MISHKIIAKLLEDVAGSDLPGADEKIFAFLKKNKLLGLFPKAERVISLKREREGDLKFLKIKTRKNSDIDSASIEKIKKALSVPAGAGISIFEDPLVSAGFLASYNGMIFDGRVGEMAGAFSKKLKEGINR